MKPKGCIFRVQFSKKITSSDGTSNQPFRLSKSRDMHNHNFIDPAVLNDQEKSKELPAKNEVQVHTSNDFNEGGLQTAIETNPAQLEKNLKLEQLKKQSPTGGLGASLARIDEEPPENETEGQQN